MRTWGDIIHVRLSYCSVGDSFWKDSVSLRWRSNILFCNVLKVYAFGFVLTNLHVSLWNIKEILDFLEVDLHHRYFDSEFDVRRLLWYFGEYLWDESWEDTFFYFILIIWTDASESFSRRGLSICKNSTVETFECKVYNVFSDFLINLLLSDLLVEDSIVSEWIFGVSVLYLYGFLCKGVNNGLSVLFFIVERSNP